MQARDGALKMKSTFTRTESELMPDINERSDVRLVAFQCTTEQYRSIADAAAGARRAVSEWIRETLLHATERAANDERFPERD